MNAQHTPGPWVADESGFGTDVRAGTELVASPAWTGDRETTDANARLIAAAPELLDALLSVRKEYREGYGLKCIDQVDAAIAKATGAAP